MIETIHKLKILLVLLILLVFHLGFSQNTGITRSEIQNRITEARNALSDLDCGKSLRLSKRALIDASAINDNVLLAKVYNVIGSNYVEFSDSEKAIKYYKKALYYANLTDNDTIKDWIYNNLGSVHTYYKDIDFEKAIGFYKKGLVYCEKTKNFIQITYNSLNISGTYFFENEFEKGYPFLKKAAQYISKHNEVEARITMYSQYGTYYSYLNQNEMAEKCFKKALSYGENEKTNLLDSYLAEVYNDFSKHYFKIKDYKNAYIFLEKYNELNKKIYTEERKNKTNITGSDIELDEYKREIDKIENEKQIQSYSLKQTRVIVFLFIGIFIILLLLLYTLYRNNQLRKKSNKELKIANEELLIAKEQAEEASLLKSQFISTISHELRTPLYGVVGITDLIADEHKELKDSTYLKSLKFSAKYLLSLVNDILQVYKIEEKKIVLESSIFNLSDELNSIMESLKFLAVKNNIKLLLEVDDAIPEFIIGDKIRFSQIFMNLISNSLKFTKDGCVKIVAKLERNEASFCFVTFKVIDTGIGIAKEHQQKIFEKFVQIERKEDDYQGTGLGLSIVKQLINLYGSEIHCESEENVGTKMIFTIGFDTDETKRNELLKNLEVDFSEERTYKILVVEDNKINQIVTKKILDIRHFESVIVDDGYAALKVLENEVFDVILMDINMPKINGFDTSKLIRKNGITTPIIAVTAFDKQEIIEQVQASKMNEVIVKPFEPNHLYKMIIHISNKIEEESNTEI